MFQKHHLRKDVLKNMQKNYWNKLKHFFCVLNLSTSFSNVRYNDVQLQLRIFHQMTASGRVSEKMSNKNKFRSAASAHKKWKRKKNTLFDKFSLMHCFISQKIKCVSVYIYFKKFTYYTTCFFRLLLKFIAQNFVYN